MPRAQFLSLVKLVKQLMGDSSLTLDDVYPHGQVAYTDCPGCTYSKVPALGGRWSYDEFESAVIGEVINDPDVYLSVRVRTSKADALIAQLIEMGYATKKLELA